MNLMEKVGGMFSNIATITIVLITCILPIKRYLVMQHISGEATTNEVGIGSKISIPDVDWSRKDETLLFALKPGCEACRQSGVFYQRLANDLESRAQLVVISQASTLEIKRYIESIGLSVREVRQVSLQKLGIHYVPTLILVSGSGIVQDVWIGKATEAREFDIWNRLHDRSDNSRGSATHQAIGPPLDPSIINAQHLKMMKNRIKKYILIDVRDRKEFARGHIREAQNIPVDELGIRALNELNSSDQIIVYCNCYENYLGKVARRILVSQGFTKVLVLGGEINAWKHAGLETVGQ